MYSSATCTGGTEELTFTEIGAMGNLGRFVFNGAATGPSAFGRVARTITITPMSVAKAISLGRHCPCGSANFWAENAPRQITTCPTVNGDTCNMSALFWYDGGEFGMPMYSSGELNDYTLSDTSAGLAAFSFSQWQASYSAVGGSVLAESLLDSGAACTATDNSASFCGTYGGACMAQIDAVVPTTYSQNAQELLILSGDADPDGNADGQISFFKEFFNNTGTNSNPCAPSESTLSVSAVGFYSSSNMPDNANYDVETGYQQILIQYPSLIVTPTSPEYVSYLQNNCACSGQWQLNTPRTLTYCASGCDALFSAGIFPGGALGRSGYGTIQLTDSQLRISTLVDNAQDGPNQLMSMTTTINPQVQPCANPSVSSSLCGHMELPCHSIQLTDGTLPAYAATGVMYATGPLETCQECFYMNTTYYAGETGCEENSGTTYAQVMQYGFYGVQSHSGPQVPYGNNVIMTSVAFVVTPLSQTAVTDLNLLCACTSVPGTWAVGVPRNINETCPPEECTFSLFRQQFGTGAQYGVFQRLGSNLRFSAFNASESVGYSFNLTMQDYQWVTINSQCAQTLPEEPSGANPHPSPIRSSGEAKGMSGGDVFILILFLVIVIYFGGGMAYNFQRTGGFKNGGVPVIPHVQFWRGIPVLVAEGCHFTFTQRCGTKGKGPVYTSFGGPGPVDKDLGNKEDRSGYGAL